MKTFRLIMVSLGALSAVSVLGADRFTINGIMPGVNDSVRVMLVNIERDKGEKIAEVFTVDGKFSLSDTVKMPSLCKLNFQVRGKDGKFWNYASPRLMVENTDINVSFNVPLDSLGKTRTPEANMSVQGSSSHAQFLEYLAACSAAEVKDKETSYESARKYFDSNADKDTMLKYDALKQIAADELLDAQRRFIAAHPDYHISAALTYQQLIRTFVYTDAQLVAMAEMVKSCPDTARVARNGRVLDWSRKYALKRVYPDFDVCDVNNATQRFSQYVTPGKYTFIDFWASWCGPCRAAIPHVRTLYNKYADKMNVYSISCDDNEAAWRKAMDKEQMEWTQLHLNEEQMGVVPQLFWLSSIPRLLLLDPEGRIVCSTNSPDEIDDYLAKNVAL